MRRPLAIVVLAAVLLQGVLGCLGTANVVAICLGGGHEHGPAEVAGEHHQLACSHESDWPAPVPPDDDDRCGCTDIEFVLTDLLWVRSSDDGVVTASTAPPALVATLPVGAPTAPIIVQPADPPWGRGGRERCAIICSTRLLL